MEQVLLQVFENKAAVQQFDVLRQLGEEVLGAVDATELLWRLLLAFEAQEPVGFKLGHQRGRCKYLSWLGGVKLAFRRRGHARRLMSYQAEWCRQRGYQGIQTQTLNQWKDMLLLNLNNGFDIVGVTHDPNLGLKISLEKQLQSVFADKLCD